MPRRDFGQAYKKEIQLFARRLRQLRKLRGKTQLDLGLETQLGPQHISDLESGAVDPTLSTLVRLSESLDISPVCFFLNSREAEKAIKLFKLDSLYEPQDEEAQP